MNIKRPVHSPSAKGPTENFTGIVRIDPLFEAPDPARARGASVTFEPALGQPGIAIRWPDLIVMSGLEVQSEVGRKKKFSLET